MVENQTPVDSAPATPNRTWIWWLLGGGCALLLCAAIVVGAALLLIAPVTTH